MYSSKTSSLSEHPPSLLLPGLFLALISVPLGLFLLRSGSIAPPAAYYVMGLQSIVEVLSIIVAAAIFIVGWHVVDDRRPKASVLLACGFLAVAMLDTAHLFSRTGLPDFFTENTTQKTTLLWLFARLVAAISLMVYVLSSQEQQLLTDRRGRLLALGLTLIGVIPVTGLVLYVPEVFPQMHDPVRGFTDFRFFAEALAVSLHLVTLLLIWFRWHQIQVYQHSALVMSIVLMMVGESFFLIYSETQGIGTFVGHTYKAIAYVYLYRAMFLDGVRLPIERLQEAHRAIQAFARQNEQLVENAPDAIVGVGRDGHIIFANNRLETMLGYQKQELVGQSIEMLLPPGLREQHMHVREEYQRAPTGRPMLSAKGLVGRHKDGRDIPLDIALGTHQGEYGVQVTAFIRDISERRQLEEEMRHRATHDTLTGLPNRALMQERLQLCFAQAESDNTVCALMMIDLDNFKDINDGWGHSLGDKLLVTVANRLRGALRDGDTVARFGGDEFVVLATGLKSTASARTVVQKIMDVMKNVFVLGQQQFHVSASVGVALYPGHAQNPEALLSQADIAMYRAKMMGRRTACYFDESMGMHQQETLRLKTWLTEAIDSRQLELHYQPQYRLADGQITGFEALLRWPHPLVGDISPDVFIPIAESSGLIIPLTEWVFETACQQIRHWSLAGLDHRISVNVSAMHFRQHGLLLSLVKHSIRAFEIEPRLLGLELTETALMDDTEVVVRTLKQLGEIGVHLSIDDFGTGYSSLASLQLFPVHTLKIDRSFMRDLHHNKKSAAIVKGLVSLGSSLDLEVLAEGVETMDQYDILRATRCDSIQGWLMNPALPESECTALLQGLAAEPGK